MTADESADDVVRLTFDAQADAAYLMLGSGGEGEVSRSIPVGLGGSDQDVDVVLDIDANGPWPVSRCSAPPCVWRLR